MRTVLIFLFCVILSSCGSGGGQSDNTCSFSITPLLNEETGLQTTSVWQCTGQIVSDFQFRIYGDHTGLSSATGEFTWSEPACGEIEIQGSVSQTITDITISPDGNQGTFISNQVTGSDMINCVRNAIEPPPMRGHAATYDTDRKRMVLFGGGTWEYDGTRWIQIRTANRPTYTYEHAMAYDSIRRKVVLVTGVDSSPQIETWEYDGNDWTKQSLSVSPPKRSYHAMTFDTARGMTVLYGGRNGVGGAGISIHDTWEYDGTSWTEKNPSTIPNILYGSVMSYDSLRSVSVLFGLNAHLTSTHTYEWDGFNWNEVFAVYDPDQPSFGSMAFDKGRNVTVLATPKIYEWDGTNWSETGYVGKLDQTMVYDDINSEILLFGGYQGTTLYNDLQVWDGVTLYSK